MKKYISYILFFALHGCGFNISDSLMVKIINHHTNIPMHGNTFCQTLEEAKIYGGRLCYHVYPYPQISAGALIVAYAVQLNENGTIKEIYIALTANSRNKTIHLGGFFDPLDSSNIKLNEKNKQKEELKYLNDYKVKKEIKMIDYFSSDIYKKGEIIASEDFNNDFDLLATAIREAKEEAGWNLNRDDFLSQKLSVILEQNKAIYGHGKQKKTHFTAIAILPLGTLDNYGNLFIPDKNINFKNFKADGYDDIDTIYFFPLSKINLIHEEEQPIEVFTLPKYYHPIIKSIVPDILENALKKYNNISLQQVVAKLNNNNVNINEENMINGENIKKILQKYSKKSIKRTKMQKK